MFPYLASVKLTDQKSNNNLLIDNSTTLFFKCNFCEKYAKSYERSSEWTQKITGNGNYCTFCVRNDYYTKRNKNILITSFRGVIGYLYYSLYKIPLNPKLYVSDIEDMIETHRKIGLLNPVFNYDEESFCWFIDFGKIGKSGKKIQVKDVKNTFSEILTSFNLYQLVEGITLYTLVKKYHEAVDAFHQYRVRPEGKRILIPTLKGCSAPSQIKYTTTKISNKTIPVEECRDFLPSNLTKRNRI